MSKTLEEKLDYKFNDNTFLNIPVNKSLKLKTFYAELSSGFYFLQEENENENEEYDEENMKLDKVINKWLNNKKIKIYKITENITNDCDCMTIMIWYTER